MKMNASILPRLALALLVLLLIFSMGRTAKDAVMTLASKGGEDQITPYEDRFAGIKKKLAGHAVVSYITDVPPEKLNYNSPEIAEYYLTQYALAPVLVDMAEDHPLAVGNFHRPPSREVLAEKRMRLIEDYGNGVMLLEREGSR
jgi:hypothetical protein